MEDSFVHAEIRTQSAAKRRLGVNADTAVMTFTRLICSIIAYSEFFAQVFLIACRLPDAGARR
jgi:hypothetical protein